MPGSPALPSRSQPTTPRRRALDAALVLAGALFSALMFLHAQIRSGFALVTGDIYDGRIEVSLLQHWFNVLRGVEHWNRTAYFYPLYNTLGFNDGYLIYGLVFSVFRVLGVEPMLASDLVNLVVRLIGYAGFIAVAVELLGLPLLWATLGATVFSIANNMALQEVHQQLLSVCFAPVLVWLLGRAWRALPSHPGRAAGFGSAAALFYGAWLLTGFYMAWFTTFFACLWGSALLVTAGRPGRGQRRRVLARLWRWPSAVVLLVLCAALAPFLHVYLPTAALTGQHSFVEAFNGLPDPGDWFRLGTGNLLFGWLEPLLDAGLHRTGRDEFLVGFTPLLWLAAVLGGVLCWRRLSSPSGQIVPAPRPAWQALAIATLLSLLLGVQVDGATAWTLVYRHVPGAAAIRQETRFLLLLDLPMVLLAMTGLRWLSLRWPPAAMIVLSAGLVLADITVQDAQGLDRTQERLVTERIPQSPAGCQAFVVLNRGDQPVAGSPATDALYHHTVDAMMLAEQRALPTLNGYATFVPPRIATLNQLPLYPSTLRDYVREEGVQARLCGLDLDRHRWVFPLPGPAPLPPGGIRFTGDDANDTPFLGLGWSRHEADGRWTLGRRVVMELTLPSDDRGRRLRLDLSALPFFPPHAQASPLTVTVNGVEVARWTPLPGQQHFSTELAGDLPGLPVMRIEFLIDRPMTPRSIDGTADDRELGIRVRALGLTPVQ